MIEIENFLSKKQCDYFIKFHNDNFDTTDNTNKSLNDLGNGEKTEVINFQYFLRLSQFRYVFTLLCNHIQNINKQSFISYLEIVKWYNGSSQKFHKDSDFLTWTSIIYLNDNYEGGETIVNDKIIKPKQGKIVTFQGKDLEHKVNEIKNNNRYTIPVWYTDIDENLYGI